MPRVLKYKNLIKALHHFGYHEVRQKGSHVVFKNDRGGITVVPKNGSGEVLGGTVGKICHDISIAFQDFEKFL